LDVGSREAGRRRPTCSKVQVINGLTRHGGEFFREIQGNSAYNCPVLLANVIIIKYNIAHYVKVLFHR